MTNPEQWGLPADFCPVRYAIPDDVKAQLRPLLLADEPVVVSLANEGYNLSLVATPRRLFSVKTGAGAGVSGFAVREYPWAGIVNLGLQQAALNVKFSINYKTHDGRTVETGRRAALGKPAVDNLMPFEPTAGNEAFAAIKQIWQHRLQNPEPTSEEESR